MTVSVPSVRVPGLVDALRPLVEAIGRLSDALLGYTVVPSEEVPIGGPLRIGGQLFMHPLDVIAMQHEDAPHTRLDEAMAWIVDRANEKFDRAVERVGGA